MISKKPDEAEVFNLARQIVSPDVRAAYLNQVCGNNHDFRQRVEQLLTAFEKQPSFLNTPPIDIAATLEQPLAEKAGRRIGPYKLLEKIGEGGMGTVFMAEQETPVQRRVALKIVRPDRNNLEPRFVFPALRSDGNNIALSLSGHWLAMSTLNGEIQVWDIHSERSIRDETAQRSHDKCDGAREEQLPPLHDEARKRTLARMERRRRGRD